METIDDSHMATCPHVHVLGRIHAHRPWPDLQFQESRDDLPASAPAAPWLDAFFISSAVL
jgi:hypothetical protein